MSALVGLGGPPDAGRAAWERVAVAAWRIPPGACVADVPTAHLGLFACTDRCRPIAWQLDTATHDGDGDTLRWMLADGGRQRAGPHLPLAADCAVELAAHAGTGARRWVYAAVRPAGAALAPPLVGVDAAADRVDAGAVRLGFTGGIPTTLAVRTGPTRWSPNLLDRLKVRAAARFLGLIPLGRDEGDLATRPAHWDVGPIRAERHQRQHVRLGFGLRTPTLRIAARCHRDWAELPVAFRLNFPPAYFFRSIRLDVYLDFAHLAGWSLEAGAGDPPWVAARGPQTTLVVALDRSPSLAAVTPRPIAAWRSSPAPPERVAGEHPALGFRLGGWRDVGAGHHRLVATAYALPPGTPVGAFLAARVPVAVTVGDTFRPGADGGLRRD